MTLNIRLDRLDGTETVWEEGEGPLGLITSLELGPGVRRAWVANVPMSQEVVDRTREALLRHGFDVGVSS